MSTPAGQSLIPYPWSERKKFNDSRRLISPVVRVTRILMYVATVLCPPTFVAHLWARFGYRRYNDSWSKRGLLVIAVGIIGVALFSPDPVLIGTTWVDVLRSLGPDSTINTQDSIITAMLLASPYCVTIQGLHSLTRSYQIERTTNAFLRGQRPTPFMRARAAWNTRVLRHGSTSRKHNGMARFGVVVDDRIPWRQSRYGMVVEAPVKRMGHGMFIGSNGTGKTKAAETFTHYVLRADAAMVYIDFKASVSTMRELAATAQDNDRPCHVLDIGFNSSDTSWYDLFAWDGSPSDKASVLIECLQFPEGEGGVAHYRGLAEAWMPMQIEAAELVGLGDGEGMFDFLLATSVPTVFQERIAPLRESSNPSVRAKYEAWTDAASRMKVSDLSGLHSELAKIVNAAGHRLKPNRDNPTPVAIRDVMDNGGLIYIGIASGVNDVVVKVLGSFLFKELSILVSARSRVADTGTLRDVFVIPDEASEMEERAEMMNPIYTMAREARVFIWPSFQSFADWPTSTQKEIKANARNFIAFQIPERETAAAIGETLPDPYAWKQMSQEETRQQAFQEQALGISGDTRLEVVTDAFLRPNIELSQIPIHQAYIWFKDRRRISTGTWWGRRRVKRDQNDGDAPRVKLVPYEQVHTGGHDTHPSSEIPDTSQDQDAYAPTVLPPPHSDDTHRSELTSETTPTHVQTEAAPAASAPPEDEDPSPEPEDDDALPIRRTADDGPPAPLSFRRTPESAQQTRTAPPPATDDEGDEGFTDDGATPDPETQRGDHPNGDAGNEDSGNTWFI